MNTSSHRNAFRGAAPDNDLRPTIILEDFIPPEYTQFNPELALEIDRAIGNEARAQRPHPLPAPPLSNSPTLRLGALHSLPDVFDARSTNVLFPSPNDVAATTVPDLQRLPLTILPYTKAALKPTPRTNGGNQGASEARKARRMRRRPKGWTPIPREQRVYKICGKCGQRNHVRRLCCEKCYTAKAEMRTKNNSSIAGKSFPNFSSSPIIGGSPGEDESAIMTRAIVGKTSNMLQ